MTHGSISRKLDDTRNMMMLIELTFIEIRERNVHVYFGKLRNMIVEG